MECLNDRHCHGIIYKWHKLLECVIVGAHHGVSHSMKCATAVDRVIGYRIPIGMNNEFNYSIHDNLHRNV